MQTFSYHHPIQLQSLFELIHQVGPNFRLLAGGTDLLVRLKTGRITPNTVIDIKGIPELNSGIQQETCVVRIGALTLMATLETDPMIQQYFPALADAVHNVGSVQIRNRATIGGNLCNASPAADSAPALLIYNAAVNCVSPRGERSLALRDFFLNPGKTALAVDELAKDIIIPIPLDSQAAAFTRLSRRKGVDLATVNLCCQVKKSGLTRFALGAVGPVPFIVEEAEGILTSESVSPEQKKKCIAKLMAKAAPISDIRASKEYRQAMLAVLAQRALFSALERLQSTQ
jgi:CO/xanthine dehydrogenase FAD-binding subunit